MSRDKKQEVYCSYKGGGGPGLDFPAKTGGLILLSRCWSALHSKDEIQKVGNMTRFLRGSERQVEGL